MTKNPPPARNADDLTISINPLSANTASELEISDNPLSAEDKSRKLFEAAKEGDVEKVNVLVSTQNVDYTHNDSFWGPTTPLFIACKEGHIDVAKALIAKGADLNLANQYGGATPLLIACKEGHIDVSKALIAGGADLDLAESGFKATPLIMACSKGHVEIVIALIDKGANLEKADYFGNAPLYGACKNGHTASAEALLKAGANTDCLREEGILYGYQNTIRSDFKNASEEMKNLIKTFIDPKKNINRDESLERRPSSEVATSIVQEIEDGLRRNAR